MHGAREHPCYNYQIWCSIYIFNFCAFKWSLAGISWIHLSIKNINMNYYYMFSYISRNSNDHNTLWIYVTLLSSRILYIYIYIYIYHHLPEIVFSLKSKIIKIFANNLRPQSTSWLMFNCLALQTMKMMKNSHK